MQPSDHTPLSIDYLDQIAPPEKKPGMSNRLFPIIVIAGLVIALLIGVLAILSTGRSANDDMVRLALRLKTLQSVADSSRKSVKSSELRSTNGNLSIFLTNTNRDIATPLKANKVSLAKPDPKIAASESGSELKARLEDARFNAVFDRTYAREMSYQLETVDALMQQIYAGTKSRSMREFIEVSRNNLQPLRQQFADFSAANS